MSKTSKTTIAIAILAGVLSGVISSLIVWAVVSNPSAERRIKDYYLTETAVLVSPHHLRQEMDKGDDTFILVDVRTQEEYEREHIVGAINIPADEAKMVNSFAELEKETDKEIIIYCYSMPCMTGRKVGAALVEHGIYVKELGVGWNEWRYFWELWNFDHELESTFVEDYVVSGSEPGVPILKEARTDACSASEEFGC